MQHGDSSVHRQLPALYNKLNYCTHAHVYLVVGVHVHLFIGFISA